MNYITLDLEWNQAYMQQALAVQKRIGSHLHGEVIQIGAVKLNEAMEIIGSYSIIVKPKFFCRLHRHEIDVLIIGQNEHRLCGGSANAVDYILRARVHRLTAVNNCVNTEIAEGIGNSLTHTNGHKSEIVFRLCDL